MHHGARCAAAPKGRRGQLTWRVSAPLSSLTPCRCCDKLCVGRTRLGGACNAAAASSRLRLRFGAWGTAGRLRTAASSSVHSKKPKRRACSVPECSMTSVPRAAGCIFVGGDLARRVAASAMRVCLRFGAVWVGASGAMGDVSRTNKGDVLRGAGRSHDIHLSG